MNQDIALSTSQTYCLNIEVKKFLKTTLKRDEFLGNLIIAFPNPTSNMLNILLQDEVNDGKKLIKNNQP